MARQNKRQRQLAALAQARRYQSVINEAPDDIVDQSDSSDLSVSDELIEIDKECFSSVSFQSYLNNRPVYYYGDSERTKRRRRSENEKAAKLTGQDLFAAWGIAKSAEESIVPIVRAYNKTSHTNDDILNALGLITEVCASLKNKKRVKTAAFSLDSPFDTIRVLAIRDYITFLSEGLLKVESSKKAADRYIRVIQNRSIEWFARQILKWGDYLIVHKQLSVHCQGKHKKIVSYIDDEDIRLQICSWLRSEKPSKRTGIKLKAFLSNLEPDPISISLNTAISWLNTLCFAVTDTDKKKCSIYIDGHERSDVVAYRNRFCDRWSNKYLPRMTYFEGDDMKAVEPVLNGEQRMVPIFHDESIFRSNEDQRYCRLEKDEQILKPKSAGRGIMVSEFVCPCHGRMVDPDTGEPCRVYLKYGKNYDGYWTGENVAAQLRDTHPTFVKLHPDCLALYIFDNSANHHKIATDSLNARKLNLKDGGKNTPVLRDGFYTNADGDRIVHDMQTDNGKQKGLRTILTERGLWIDGMSRKEALDLLLQQEDFNPDNLSSILDETAKSLGAWLEFVPKFHPEFNFIEMYWGYVKRKVRNECDYDWESLLSHVPLSLDSVPLLFMRKAYTKCCRYIYQTTIYAIDTVRQTHTISRCFPVPALFP